MLIPNELFFRQIEEMLRAGEHVRIRMKGHSMRPLLRSEKDDVMLVPCTEQEIAVGEIVLFHYRERYILHRIIARQGDRYILAGDGNYRMRESCTREAIIGRAVQVIRPSGHSLRCDSPRWRRASRLWLAIPEWLRRQLLRILWHLRIR